MKTISEIKGLEWFETEDIRPYVFVREENRIIGPGTKFALPWFQPNPVYKNPLLTSNVYFADQILNMEAKAFSASNMEMPRWVFYDCAVMPGFVAGFAIKAEKASTELRAMTGARDSAEWIPLSLFIIIPTMGSGEWVAHNLCSSNPLVPSDQKLYGLGFLTKAFALWYANIEVCCGMTQWRSPAVKLHTHYGDFEVLTAYTPVHSYAKTLTYRVKTHPKEWERFFTKEAAPSFSDRFRPAGFQVDPTNEESLRLFQQKIEKKQGPFYLDSNQIRNQDLDAPLDVFRPN